MTDTRSNKKIKVWFKQRAAEQAAAYLYLIGRKPAHYPVPSTNVYSAKDYFATYYALELMEEIFREGL